MKVTFVYVKTVFTYWMAPELNSMLLFVSRVLLSLLMVALNISCIYTNIKAVEKIDSEYYCTSKTIAFLHKLTNTRVSYYKKLHLK